MSFFKVLMLASALILPASLPAENLNVRLAGSPQVKRKSVAYECDGTGVKLDLPRMIKIGMQRGCGTGAGRPNAPGTQRGGRLSRQAQPALGTAAHFPSLTVPLPVEVCNVLVQGPPE